ncbi:helix-turn-helix domain-containing protein [Verrucomicrobiales bacterium BCK34]|nr:helix-turn-helix domain-containing protein [Verrucomicrobiales bacterium BCK34]
MKRDTNTPSVENRIFRKLSNAALFAIYRKAFIDATGMGLRLVPFDEVSALSASEFRNPFCSKLHLSKSACRLCDKSCQNLYRSAETEAKTISCFANLRETAIPIRAGGQTVALLVTGQVSTTLPSEVGFESIGSDLKKSGATDSEIADLKKAWMETRSLPVEQYEGIITLLAAFAIQLSEHLNRLLVEESHAEPDVVIKAKQYINVNLEDKVALEEVSQHVGVSTFYFCKVFKQSTGMTLTEYVNRRRVERAKRKLLNPQARVTEVAFDVGYQSLSQFNRSFLRYVGLSPSRFRESQAAERNIQRLEVA